MTAGNYVRNLSGGGPANPCWPYQPAEARTAAGPSDLSGAPRIDGDGGFAALGAGCRRITGVSRL